MNTAQQPARTESSLVIGGLLIAIGLIFLAGQTLGLDLQRVGWPFFVIVPGLALLALGFAGVAWRPFLYIGGIATTVGLVLLYQNNTGHWESWAYAWALVAPGSIGVAQLIEGALDGKPARLSEGVNTLGVGIALFAVGAAFFEGVLGLGGFDLGPLGADAFAIVLIALGVLMLVTRFIRSEATAR